MQRYVIEVMAVSRFKWIPLFSCRDAVICLLWHLFAGDCGEQVLVHSAENDQYVEEE